MDNAIKKNILDLQFQKSILVASGAVVVAFTYLIAIAVGLVAGEINLQEDTRIIAVFSTFFLASSTYFFLRSRKQMSLILTILKNMKA